MLAFLQLHRIYLIIPSPSLWTSIQARPQCVGAFSDPIYTLLCHVKPPTYTHVSWNEKIVYSLLFLLPLQCARWVEQSLRVAGSKLWDVGFAGVESCSSKSWLCRQSSFPPVLLHSLPPIEFIKDPFWMILSIPTLPSHWNASQIQTSFPKFGFGALLTCCLKLSIHWIKISQTVVPPPK